MDQLTGIQLISRWAEPTDYRFRPPRVFIDTNLQMRHNPEIASWCATYAWNNDGVEASVAEVGQKLTSLQVCCCVSMQAM